MPIEMNRKHSATIHWTARKRMLPTSVVNPTLKTVISESKKFAAAWQFEATKVVHAVVLHQATINPKSRPKRRPPDSAAQK